MRLAKESVFRYYRIQVPITIPGYHYDGSLGGGSYDSLTELDRIKLVEIQNTLDNSEAPTIDASGLRSLVR